MDHSRDHLAGQTKHMESVTAMSRGKMLRIDKARNREIPALTMAVEKKATLVDLSHLSDQLHAVNMSLSTKAEIGKVEQLGKTCRR